MAEQIEVFVRKTNDMAKGWHGTHARKYLAKEFDGVKGIEKILHHDGKGNNLNEIPKINVLGGTRGFRILAANESIHDLIVFIPKLGRIAEEPHGLTVRQNALDARLSSTTLYETTFIPSRKGYRTKPLIASLASEDNEDARAEIRAWLEKRLFTNLVNRAKDLGIILPKVKDKNDVWQESFFIHVTDYELATPVRHSQSIHYTRVHVKFLMGLELTGRWFVGGLSSHGIGQIFKVIQTKVAA